MQPLIEYNIRVRVEYREARRSGTKLHSLHSFKTVELQPTKGLDCEPPPPYAELASTYSNIEDWPFVEWMAMQKTYFGKSVARMGVKVEGTEPMYRLMDRAWIVERLMILAWESEVTGGQSRSLPESILVSSSLVSETIWSIRPLIDIGEDLETAAEDMRCNFETQKLGHHTLTLTDPVLSHDSSTGRLRWTYRIPLEFRTSSDPRLDFTASLAKRTLSIRIGLRMAGFHHRNLTVESPVHVEPWQTQTPKRRAAPLSEMTFGMVEGEDDMIEVSGLRISETLQETYDQQLPPAYDA